MSRFQVSDAIASEDSGTIHYNDLKPGPSRSSGHAGNITIDKGRDYQPPLRLNLQIFYRQNSSAPPSGRKAQELLARGCSLHSVDSRGSGIPPEAYPKKGKDPYLLAAYLRQGKVLKLLLEHGADSSRAESDGVTALHAFIFGVFKTETPPTESIVALLLQHRTPLEQVYWMGWTPLMYSVDLGFLLVLTKTLLDHGANVNIFNQSGAIILHYAARGENPDIVALLLHKGADVDRTSPDGQTALHWACSGSASSSAQIVRML